MVKMKKKKVSKSLIVTSVILSILCIFLVLVELYNNKKGYINQYGKQMEMYVETLLSNSEYRAKEENVGLEEGMIRTIETEFPTSSRCFCLVGKDNEILFLRDKTKTAEIFDTTVAMYIGLEGAYVPRFQSNTTTTRLQNGERYLVTRVDVQTETGLLTLAVCMQENYLLASGNYKVFQQHMMVYIGLLVIALVVGVSFLSIRVREKTEWGESLQEQLIKDRVLIEKQAKRLESRERGDVMGGEGSFYPRSVVERVLNELTREQRRRCRKIMVYFDDKNHVLCVQLSVLIERMLNGIGVFCLWAEDEFQIIVFNAENEAVENIAKQLVVQYKNMFQKDLKNVKIVVDRL